MSSRCCCLGTHAPWLAYSLGLGRLLYVILCFYYVPSLHFIDWRVRIQNNVLTIWLAVLSIYCIDFSINTGPSPFLSLPHLTSSNGSRPRPNGRCASLPRAALCHSLGSADGFHRRHCRLLYVRLSFPCPTLPFHPAIY